MAAGRLANLDDRAVDDQIVQSVANLLRRQVAPSRRESTRESHWGAGFEPFPAADQQLEPVAHPAHKPWASLRRWRHRDAGEQKERGVVEKSKAPQREFEPAEATRLAIAERRTQTREREEAAAFVPKRSVLVDDLAVAAANKPREALRVENALKWVVEVANHHTDRRHAAQRDVAIPCDRPEPVGAADVRMRDWGKRRRCEVQRRRGWVAVADPRLRAARFSL